MTFRIAFLLLCLVSNRLVAQTIYFNAETQANSNKLFKMHLGACDSIPLFACAPIADTPIGSPWSVFCDIAIDANNFYYCSGGGSLYSRGISDSNCQYLGSFNYSINALVADAEGKIWAAGTKNGVCKLFTYDVATQVFHTVGSFPTGPNGFYSLGDLFFYENKLFMTAVTQLSNRLMVEVNTSDPTLSCQYMSLNANLYEMEYGAFSVDYGAYSKADIFCWYSTNLPVYTKWANLREVDMVSKTVGPVICTYQIDMLGAAAYYDKTNVREFCTPTPTPTVITNQSPASYFVKLQNPATGNIRLNTNINPSQITAISLRDMTGKVVKQFAPSVTLDISDLTDGIYTFELTTSFGESYRRKLIIAQ